ncbi:ABC transporter substrate-binding protein [Rubeoparvulum massiliense]|uniref:ABC transporter substrate-binding protein n=1 Tax=Rubeoparvulum massiliense TaxID=1631346 RepID=UPI00065DC31F|nr:extracellular solute-binding protein [Rubeoparvulum massiliense]
MKKWFALMMVVVVGLSAVLAGCSSGTNQETNTKEPKVLRVAGEGEDWIRNEWVTYFQVANPNVEVEFVDIDPYRNHRGRWSSTNEERPDPVQEVIKELEDHPVDLVILNNQSMMQALIDNGIVQPLDTFMKQDQGFNLDQMVPAVRDKLQGMGNGTLYTISPTFDTYVLAYNKEMFDRFNQPYPTDNMTWDDLFTLGENFNEGEGIEATYGVSLGDSWEISQYINIYAAQLGLNPVDLDTKTAYLNTPEWRELWSMFADAYEQKKIARPVRYEDYIDAGYSEDQIPWSRTPFHGNLAAMGVMTLQDVSRLEDTFKYDRNAKKFAYDIVAFPSPSSNTNMGAPIRLEWFFAVPTNSSNASTAWDFISFNMSAKMMEVKGRSRGMLGTVEEYMIPTSMELNKQAFTTRTETPELNRIFDYSSYDPTLDKVREIAWNGEMYFNQVIEGMLTVDEALEKYQEDAERTLANLEAEDQDQ